MKIKQLGIISMAFTFAGCLLGAGYVSGQELWQYFGSYGSVGIIGLMISLVLVALSSALVLWISDHAKTGTVDRLIIRFEIPWLRVLVGVLFSVLYFVIAIIMIAGITSLCSQLFGMNRTLGSALATALIMTTVYFGFSGMVRVFELVVPVLVVAAIIISVICIGKAGAGNIRMTASEVNPMLGPWYMSALNYTALNLFASIGILAPLVSHFKSKKVGPVGIALGTFALIGIAILIILAMATDPAATEEDLPMLYIAQQMGSVYTAVYAALLFLAMYGNANASMVAALNYYEKRFAKDRYGKGRIIRIVILGALAFACSLTGFTNLVATVYPVIGYVGIASMVLLIEQAIHLLKNKNRHLNPSDDLQR